jgi:alpha-amylase/alpha-mannosidase (GH57 family)
MLTNDSNKYICIHGHFYQPPRENAWLEVIETQDSASPFHDWNERINFESYAPNATARILDDKGYIKNIVNNYSKINFNIGATLLSWLEVKDPETYNLVLEADKMAQAQFDGHGTAIAQVYSHLIMPLANRQDKVTQVIWGIRDFEKRFDRKPEGIWLAETAVDTETLEILADFNIKYTILAPQQAKAARKIGDAQWNQGGVDSRRPYLCNLPSGKSINIFVYDGNTSQAIAFAGLLNSGKAFAGKLMSAFTSDDSTQLVHVATDGESYGHHHRYGEMALADCLNFIESRELATIINYGQYLAKFPPTHEIQIHDNSSWSCVHGVERWRNDCGCNSGRAGWHQRWRAPLRDALDWLRDTLIPLYEQQASLLFHDVWAARNAYIDIILNRSEGNIDAFLAKFASKTLSKEDKVQALRLLEMQRNAILMYTSCGWFFDEISGIETHQIMQYACRAIDYAIQVGGEDLHTAFERLLAKAPSNVYENGAVSYKKHVVPSRVNLERVGMHIAAASLFEKFPQRLELFNYIAESEDFERIIQGNQRMVVGRTTVKSRITLSEKQFGFIALYLGQHNIIGNISTEMELRTFDLMKTQTLAAFRSGNLGEVITLMQTFFGLEKYTLQNLFYDEKRKILNEIAEKSLVEAEAAFRDIYNDNYQLMSSMLNTNLPIPEAYRAAVGFVVNRDLEHYFEQERLSIKELGRLIEELQKWNIKLNEAESFELAASERIYTEVKKLEQSEATLEQLQLVNSILELLDKMGIKLNIWKSQNVFHKIIKDYQRGEWVFVSHAWQDNFLKLANLLKVKFVD